MRDNGFGGAQRKPSRHDMLVRARREVAKPIETSPDALVAATGARMVAQGTSIHACRERLLGREVTCLRLGGTVECVVVYVMHKGDYMQLVSDVIWPGVVA